MGVSDDVARAGREHPDQSEIGHEADVVGQPGADLTENPSDSLGGDGRQDAARTRLVELIVGFLVETGGHGNVTLGSVAMLRGGKLHGGK